MAGSSNSSDNRDVERDTDTKNPLDLVTTESRVPTNTHYYEKDGLRTYGDDEDHDHEPPASSKSRL